MVLASCIEIRRATLYNPAPVPRGAFILRPRRTLRGVLLGTRYDPQPGFWQEIPQAPRLH